ncbi:MAG: phosphoenolpyruvate mutase, partial [Pseudobutyrivibrio sp.]|nr:phosphoenolpyruvate mutase [Pseudobutyrivibrio sp.]
ISEDETIISRQLRMLEAVDVEEVIITTGYYDKVLTDYVDSLNVSIPVKYVNNSRYSETNYIYSIYCAKEMLDDDLILMHGDLVFAKSVIEDIASFDGSCMTISSTVELPEKDFKAVCYSIGDTKYIDKVGIEYFDNAVTAQAMYKLNQNDLRVWLDSIIEFCESGNTGCYAENALNVVSHKCRIETYDYQGLLCAEIDNIQDLECVKNRLALLSE